MPNKERKSFSNSFDTLVCLYVTISVFILIVVPETHKDPVGSWLLVSFWIFVITLRICLKFPTLKKAFRQIS